MSRLDARNLGVSRGDRAVLESVSLALRPGEMVALLGANGSGKTTLLRALLGLLPPSSGRVLLNGQPMDSVDRRTIARSIAYVPQQHRAVFPFSAREIVAMGRAPVAGWRPVRDDDPAVSSALEQARVGHLADRPFAALSGGEKQSVLIARALAQGAPILLLDEPAAALDPGQKRRLLQTLRDLTDAGMTVLASIHDLEAARQAFGRAIALRRGIVRADGEPNAILTQEMIADLYG